MSKPPFPPPALFPSPPPFPPAISLCPISQLASFPTCYFIVSLSYLLTLPPILLVMGSNFSIRINEKHIRGALFFIQEIQTMVPSNRGEEQGEGSGEAEDPAAKAAC